jgi:hypothetical protein
MAYTPTNWSAGDEITSAKLNNMEKGIKDGSTTAGPAGKDGTNGKDGISLTALALVADADGKITGGTATLSDKSTIDVTVTTA